MDEKIDVRQYLFGHSPMLIVICLVAYFFYWGMSKNIWVMLFYEMLFLIPSAYLYRSVLLLPLDLLLGHVDDEVIFSNMINIEKYEILHNRYYCEWRVNYKSKGKITLTVPVCMKYDEITQIHRPQTGDKIKIRYYRYSKILCAWEKSWRNGSPS